jgi:hypothetical protein
MKKYLLLLILYALCSSYLQAQSISGSASVSYEHYGLMHQPTSWQGPSPRRPWNQVRYSFNPTIDFGKWQLPFQFNFTQFANNFTGPYANLKNQTLKQWITNPSNQLGLSPKYKNNTILLGTQYINYSKLSTGDINIFGAGVDLKPKNYLFKIFAGLSQQGINYAQGPPLIEGAYQRKHIMAQVGKEVENSYKVAFNIAYGKDNDASAIIPITATTKPQEGMVISAVNEIKNEKGFYLNSEIAKTVFNKNGLDASLPNASILPAAVTPKSTSLHDWAGNVSIGMRKKKYELGLNSQYLGATYYTLGYPNQMPDRLDLLLQTKLHLFNDKMILVASGGNRRNNISNPIAANNQIIANANLDYTISDQWTLQASYNNFGFNTQGSTLQNIPSPRNVSNDIGAGITYTKLKTKVLHTATVNYNYSKYVESSFIGNTLTQTNNLTHTFLLNYIPSFLTRKAIPGFPIRMLTAGAGYGNTFAKKKLKLRGALQYHLLKNGFYSNNKNTTLQINADYKITPTLTFNSSYNNNYFLYGNELGMNLIGARYLETFIKGGFTYQFKNKIKTK